MKSFIRICLVTALGMILVGGITVAAAGAAGKRELRERRAQNSGEGTSFSYEVSEEEITSLCFEIKAGIVTIETGDRFLVTIEDGREEDFSSRVKNGVWEIEDKREDRRKISIFGISVPFSEESSDLFRLEQPKVTITVPDGFVAEKLTVELGAGELAAGELQSRKLYAAVGAGALYLYEVSAETSAQFQIGAGEMKVYGFEGGSVDVDCGVGSLYLEGSVAGKSRIGNGIGEVKMKLTGSEGDYGYSVDCGLGSVSVGSKSYYGIGQSSVSFNSKNTFEIKCGIGNVEITFEQ